MGGQVLWIGRGRSRETARAFFGQLPAGVAQRIEAVAIDMTTAYELEIRAHCPQAEVVYDLFHMVAKYGREVVIDRVRVGSTAARRERKRRGSNGASRLGKAEYLPWSCLRSVCKATGMTSWPAAATR
ncbi:hypothetical protein CS8_050080 [Cupriavidus sp. 8B]